MDMAREWCYKRTGILKQPPGTLAGVSLLQQNGRHDVARGLRDEPFLERLMSGHRLFVIYLWGKPLAPSECEENSGERAKLPHR
jgi:hypothetical protein